MICITHQDNNLPEVKAKLTNTHFQSSNPKNSLFLNNWTVKTETKLDKSKLKLTNCTTISALYVVRLKSLGKSSSNDGAAPVSPSPNNFDLPLSLKFSMPLVFVFAEIKGSAAEHNVYGY